MEDRPPRSPQDDDHNDLSSPRKKPTHDWKQGSDQGKKRLDSTTDLERQHDVWEPGVEWSPQEQGDEAKWNPEQEVEVHHQHPGWPGKEKGELGGQSQLNGKRRPGNLESYTGLLPKVPPPKCREDPGVMLRQPGFLTNRIAN